MSIDEIKKTTKSNSIQLKDRGPLCNFTRPTQRWRKEKKKKKICHRSFTVLDTRQPTILEGNQQLLGDVT
jgi:5-methylcytosine-specific restriction endonuclease McrA